ncbi:TonB-dependent receptor domain-containing protein [Flavobacterium hauense]
MMKLKDFSLCLLFLLSSTLCIAQYKLSGKILNENTGEPIPGTEVYNRTIDKVIKANDKGEFIFINLIPGKYTLEFLSDEFDHTTVDVTMVTDNQQITVGMKPLLIQLSEVVIEERRNEVFGLTRLKDIEGTSIYAGKKTEVVILSKQMGNMAANTPRQVFSQVVGLNIYDSNDGGLQLNIGGRGLDPNRSAYFNVRQNDYDISADILGYPESYYTPPAEGLDRIEVVRGAASLQYGPQFGGLINFRMKTPVSDKKLALTTRQTFGSYGFITNFTSISGTARKFSYYTYFNYKQGDGFQPNSEFKSYNYFGNFNYQFTEKTSLGLDYTHFNYLAKQPGGLTDKMFVDNPLQSNRERNWFEVNWNLLALKFKHKFNITTDFSFNLFGLHATRNAIGFRSNRVSQPDFPNTPRDLIKGEFSNWGFETKLLHRYNFFGNKNAFVVGAKYYDAYNAAKQGAGSLGNDADFNFATDNIGSDYTFPNNNIALFTENIFRISSKFTVTPGIRFEHINTKAKGSYRKINYDNAGNVILDETYNENNNLSRSFVLLGIGVSYKPVDGIEFYSNFSQNYRSVTFNDIRISEPSYQVDENIKDEDGYTFDGGFRGKISDKLTYDVSAFGIGYNNRLGEILTEAEDFRIVRLRTNVGDAFIYGLEVFGNVNLQKTFFNAGNDNYSWSTFVNTAFTKSKYTKSKIAGIEGNEVEFIPAVNLKTGMSFGYKKFMSSLQLTYISEQYTDATNAKIDETDNLRGIEGQIPSYHIVDLSFSYPFNKYLKLETGINNLTDNKYFTRRATGYPGPGIIPSAPRTFYATLQFQL